MVKKYSYILVGAFLLAGCASPQIQTKKTVVEVPSPVNKVIESNLSINSPEYVAYQYLKYININDYENALKYVDEEMKKKYHAELLQYLETSIRYKYYEPVYDLVGKNINYEQIKKIPRDRILAAFIEKSVRKNYIFNKFEVSLDSVESKDSFSNVRFSGRFFIGIMNKWYPNSNITYKLKKLNNKWVIIDDNEKNGIIPWYIENQLQSIRKCQAKSFQVQDYTKAINLLNKDVCTYRAQVKKDPASAKEDILPELSGFMRTSKFEEEKRDQIFDNKYCMEFHKGTLISLTQDIVSDETCKALNITSENVPPLRYGPSKKAMTLFASGKGSLICKKTPSDNESKISISNGWNIKWATMEFIFMNDPGKGKFDYTECKGTE